MSLADEVRAVRTRAGFLELPHRSVVEVRGSDRVRWLNGMLSNDIEALESGGENSSAHALLLNPKAGIVAELRVLALAEVLWLDVDSAALGLLLERLERYIVADDVELVPLGAQMRRFAIEGPGAPESSVALAGGSLVCADFSLCGESALQLFVPAGSAESVERVAARSASLPRVSADAQEVLRIEAGLPRHDRELGEDVLPDEARLEAAVSTDKGCYTGQEIIARLRSRGRVNHLMVGLRFDASASKAQAALLAGERRVGEVTSACDSPDLGPIGLGFVRREHSVPGTKLACAGQRVEVVALPHGSAS